MAVRISSSATSLLRTGGLLTSGGTWTIAFWARLRADTNAIQMLLDLHTGAGAGLRLETSADGVSLRGNTYGSVGTDTATVVALVPGTWYRVAVVFSGVTYTVHVGAAGGALSSQAATTTGIAAAELFVGRESSTGGTFWDGDVAAMKSWTAALSVQELENEWAQHYPLRTDQLTTWHPLIGPTLDLVDYSGATGRNFTATTAPAVVDPPPIRWARARGPRVTLSTPPTQTLGPDGIGSAEAIGTPVLAAGPVAASPGGVASAETVSAPALAVSVAPAGVPSAEAAGLPTVVVAGVIAPTGVPSAETVSAPTLSTGPVAVTAPGVPTAESVSAPRLQFTVSPPGVSGADQVGAPAVVVGAVAVSAGGVPSAEAIGIAVLAAGPVQLTATGVPSGESIGAPRLVHVAYVVGVPSGTAVGAPVLVVGQVTIRPVGIDSGELIGAPELAVTLDTSVRVITGDGRGTPTYEAWIMARVPQQSGPPLLVEVDPIDWRSLRWGDTLSRPQTGQVTCRIPTITEDVAQRLRAPDRLPTELWIYRNGVLKMAGPLLGGEKRGDELTLVAGGLLTYAHWMYVLTDKRFDQVDQHEIARWLIDQWQATEHGHFGIDTSQVTPSGKLRDISYDRAEIHQVSRRIEELGAREGGFDAEVDPTTRALLLHSPTKGVDRSTGEDAVVFDGASIDGGSIGFSVAPGDLASDAFGSGSSATGGAALWSESSDLELRAAFGRAGISGSWSDVSEQPTLDAHVAALRDSRDQVLRVPGKRVRVTADADLEQWSNGDTVAWELDKLLGIGGAYRVRSRMVDVAETGEETVDVEFV